MSDREYFSNLDKLIRFCSYSERCKSDVDKKLKQLNIDESLRNRIRNELIEKGLVDDSRYAHSFTESRIRFNKWGKIKIRSYLRARRVDEKDIEIAFSNIDQDEYRDILRAVLERKSAQLKPEDKQNKLIRYAQSKGFEFSMIIEIIKELNLK